MRSLFRRFNHLEFQFFLDTQHFLELDQTTSRTKTPKTGFITDFHLPSDAQ